MKKMEKIIEKLETIKTDIEYYVSKNEIEVIINDFEGFSEGYEEIERELEGSEKVEKILEWLEENAEEVEGEYYHYYHFGDIVVKVGYASFDI